MDYFVLDSALWPRRLRGRNNAGCRYNCGSGPECNHAISTAGYSWYEGPLLAQSGHQLLGSRSTLNALTRPAARSIGHLPFRFDTEFLNDLACGCKLGFQKAFWSASFNPDTQFAPDSPKSPDEETSGHHRSIDGRIFPPGRST
jgi:hypothetical protein